MRTSKQKITFGRTTGKFNFLNPDNNDRRYWPISLATKKPKKATHTDLKKLTTADKRGAK